MARRRRRSFLGRLLALLFVLLVAACAVLGFSAYGIYNECQRAEGYYQELEANLNAGRFDEALSSVHKVASSLDEIEHRTHEWQWQAAGVLPYVGEDVRCVQEVSTIADSLANDALVPVITNAQNLVDGIESGNAQNLGEAIGQGANKVSGLADAIVGARAVVAECSSKANALPESHFKQVNELVDNLRNITVQIDEVFDRFEFLFSAVDVVGDIAESVAQ